MNIPSIKTFRGLAVLSIVVMNTKASFLSGLFFYQVFSFAIPFLFVSFGYEFASRIEQGDANKNFIDIVTQLVLILIFWVIVDGIFWGENWLQDIIDAKSLKPLVWNVLAIPRFALKLHPDLFFFRGTSVSLWFLFSLMFGTSAIFLQIKLGLDKIIIIVLMILIYCFVLLTGSYSHTGLSIGFYLLIEQQGPFVAYFFLSIGFLLAENKIKINGFYFLIVGIVLMVIEMLLISKTSNISLLFYSSLLSTPILVSGIIILALQYPDMGQNSFFYKIGSHYIGIYLVSVPVLGAMNYFRFLVDGVPGVVLFSLCVFFISYTITVGVQHVPLFNRVFKLK